ncbi:unnamed protein product [Lactuca virosa]|uniref:Knottin scorpion toxin-like domain-containing protein n=1 Tax=Lactuca virosa TaxID=75947 RepID=A0AAU9NP31_9ASTR|nr:unnamed protein product [Lactuca virosa]
MTSIKLYVSVVLILAGTFVEGTLAQKTNGLDIGECLDQWHHGKPCNVYECYNECQRVKGPTAGGRCNIEKTLCLCVYPC